MAQPAAAAHAANENEIGMEIETESAPKNRAPSH